MEESTFLKDLYMRLVQCWERHGSEPKNQFITSRELQRAWNGRLSSFSSTFGLGLRDDDIVEIENYFLKTLTILVISRYQSWSQFRYDFLEHRNGKSQRDRADDRLPIPRQEKESLYNYLEPPVAFLFMEMQYRFVPVIFTQSKQRVSFDPFQPLPFLATNPVKLGSGSSGMVCAETIAAGCFIYEEGGHNLQDLPVARKTMSLTEDSAKQEIDNLIEFRKFDTRQENIMTYLCIYDTENESHILSERAITNLDKFLHDTEFDRCVKSPGSIIPILKHASALAKGLGHIHENLWNRHEGVFKGLHLDVKPSNILIFGGKPDGIWKISDLGLAKVKARVPNNSNKTGTEGGNFNGKYQAPEVREGREAGPRSDVWSFGCTLILLIIRAVQSSKEVREFGEALQNAKAAPSNFGNSSAGSSTSSADDGFYQADTESQLKPTAEAWLQKLTLRESPYVQALTGTFQISEDVVISQMQNLEYVLRKMLNRELSDRCSANEVSQKLGEIAQGLSSISEPYQRMRPDIEASLSFIHSASGNHDNSAAKSAAFHSLWEVFGPGEAVYMRVNQKMAGFIVSSSQYMTGNIQSQTHQSGKEFLQVSMWNIRVLGSKVFRHQTEVFIEGYRDQRDLTKLLVVPSSLWDKSDGSTLRQQLQERGKKYLSTVTTPYAHRRYLGSIEGPEVIEHDIVIDLESYARFSRGFGRYQEFDSYTKDLDSSINFELQMQGDHPELIVSFEDVFDVDGIREIAWPHHPMNRLILGSAEESLLVANCQQAALQGGTGQSFLLHGPPGTSKSFTVGEQDEMNRLKTHLH
ncbi:hypothetical protein ACLMJK_007723 [Lecanora helva]